jgi:hypothetical protein
VNDKEPKNKSNNKDVDEKAEKDKCMSSSLSLTIRERIPARKEMKNKSFQSLYQRRKRIPRKQWMKTDSFPIFFVISANLRVFSLNSIPICRLITFY